MNSLEVSEYQVSSPLWLCIFYASILIVGNITGLIGNIMVIIATLGQKLTFKLDGGTVTFLRNLAFADVVFMLLYPLPMSLTYAARRWLYGDWICKVIGHLISVPVMANMNFILLISLHRFTRCKYPLKVHQLTPKKSNIMCSAVWAYSCLFIFGTVLQESGSEFNAVLASCTFLFLKTVFNNVIIVLFTALPFAIIVVLNFCLWLHVRSFSARMTQYRKPSNGPNPIMVAPEVPAATKKDSKTSIFGPQRAIITTTAITALFALAWMPTVIRFMVSTFAGEEFIPPWMEQLRYLYFFGPWGNPFVYVAINRGFRDYFKSFFSNLLRNKFAILSNNNTIKDLKHSLNEK